MIQSNVEKFRPILGQSIAVKNIFDTVNNFLRNQLIKAASVTDFISTSVKNGMFKEEKMLQNWYGTNVFMNWWILPIPVTNVQRCWKITDHF